jgi:hypothetical protein
MKKKGCCPLECVALDIMTKVTITTITMIIEHVLTDGQCLKSLLYNELCCIDIRIGNKGGFLLGSPIPLIIDYLVDTCSISRSFLHPACTAYKLN